MPYLFFIGLSAILLIPAFSLASEDEPPYLFGGELNYEDPLGNADFNSLTDLEKEPEQGKASEQSDFTPPPSDIVSIPTETPQIPMLQTPRPEEAPVEVVEAPIPRISKNQALTDTLKQEGGVNADGNPLRQTVEGTWVDKLATTNPLSLLKVKDSASNLPALTDDTLEELVDNARTPVNDSRRSNASVFDISGVMLRMSLAQVEEIMQNRGFRKTMQKYQIPNFIKWRNEEGCRYSGIVGYERIEACVIERAKKEKQQYVQQTKYAKFDTKEEIEVTFTSNFTDNKVYKITYKSLAANPTGNSPKAVYLRNIKVYDFWKKINQKYGKPDNKDTVTWGMGGNKPYLKAKTGYLLLEDPMLRELDYTRMSREDQRYMNTDLYSF